MIKLEFTGDQESIDILIRFGLHPLVRWSRERAIITVNVPSGKMSKVSEALWTPVVQDVSHVKVGDLKIGNMVEFPDGFIGEIDFLDVSCDWVYFSAIGTGVFLRDPEDRVWVHSNA